MSPFAHDHYRYAMEVCLVEARCSPDPSTQNAAVLLDGRKVVDVTLEHNRFPLGVEYSPDRWERPAKYGFVEHAERGAIYAAARHGIKTIGLTMVCPWAACTDCARGIIQAGIAHLVTLLPDQDPHLHWGDSVDTAMTMLAEAGVTVEYLDAKFPQLHPILRNETPWQP